MSDVHQFSTHERDTLAAVLDQVIPPSADGRLPGAGFLAHGARFDAVIRLLPGLDLGLAGGIAACDEHARRRGVTDYRALSDADRLAVLNEVAAADPGFVPSLMFLAYSTYYVEDRVIAALDLEPRPPHPQGYAMAANDLTLLEPVRARSKLWRDA
ncbi:gluconate 2-dehydrogenase subunit 3 family protein [Candidatus Binatia bacterium]|jgi:hypothetical protein|nr:gluconate 2-dehydrogenase subunit 3 family protein [Candidatus Binatia bacterium]